VHSVLTACKPEGDSRPQGKPMPFTIAALAHERKHELYQQRVSVVRCNFRGAQGPAAHGTVWEAGEEESALPHGTPATSRGELEPHMAGGTGALSKIDWRINSPGGRCGWGRTGRGLLAQAFQPGDDAIRQKGLGKSFHRGISVYEYQYSSLFFHETHT